MSIDDPAIFVCAECWNGARCIICDLPLSGWLAGDGAHCSRCIEAAVRCAACGLPIFGSYRVVRGEEGAYCERCSNDAVSCAICGVPTRDPEIQDGRALCRDCTRGRLDDHAALHRLYEDTRTRLERTLGVRLRRVPELRILSMADVDVSRLDAPHSLEKLGGLFTKESNGDTSIQLVTPLTEPRARAILAHELAHAWQSEACPDEQGRRLREGFAEWAAWKTIEGLEECAKERMKIEARTDEYGQGFRLFRGLEERGGTDAAIRYSKAARG